MFFHLLQSIQNYLLPSYPHLSFSLSRSLSNRHRVSDMQFDLEGDFSLPGYLIFHRDVMDREGADVLMYFKVPLKIS